MSISPILSSGSNPLRASTEEASFFERIQKLFEENNYKTAIKLLEEKPFLPNLQEEKLLLSKCERLVKDGKENYLSNQDSEATQNFNFALKIAKFILSSEELSIYSFSANIGLSKLLVYKSEYSCAKKHLQAAEQLLKEIRDPTEKYRLEMSLNSASGDLYNKLGHYEEAIAFYSKELELAKQLNDKESEAKINGSMGLCYLELGDICHFTKYDEESAKENYNKAKDHFEEDKKICDFLDQKEECLKASINIANCYLRLKAEGGLQTAKEIFENILEENCSEQTKTKARNGLQNLLLIEERGDYAHYEKLLEIPRLSPLQKGEFYHNLGLAYLQSQETDRLQKAKGTFEQSVEQFSILQENQPYEEWKITIFERQKHAFFQLEDVLLKLDERENAFKIVDSRLARALKLTLLGKIGSLNSSEIKTCEINIQSISEKYNTTFIIYSLCSEGSLLRIWIANADGIFLEQKKISELNKEISLFSNNLISITVDSRKKIGKSLSKLNLSDSVKIDELIDYPDKLQKLSTGKADDLEELKTALTEIGNYLQQMNKQLEKWYNLFIPEKLKEIETKNITIIPEGCLARIPFGALRYIDDQNKAKYLIEDYSISIAPSISILDILGIDNSISSNSMLIVHNPTGDLPNAQMEADSLESLTPRRMQCEFLRREVLCDAFLDELDKDYKYIHIACHGTRKKERENSVFAGGLKFADLKEEPFVYSEAILKKKISAEIVFMSTCFSGSGEIYQEGNVGLVWAFLAAGAKSVVSCLWPLYDSQFTINIVKNFYHLTFQGNSKAVALQVAVRKVLDDNRGRPDKWGLLFLSGLNNSISESTPQESNRQSSLEDSSSDFNPWEFMTAK